MDVPNDVLGLFQASVINYHSRLSEWFSVSLSERVNLGMMTIVYDLNPTQGNLQNKQLRRKLGREAAEYLTRYCAQIKNEFDQHGKTTQFSIGIEYRLALTKKASDADIVLSQGSTGGADVRIIEVPKDPSKSHPHRQKEVIQKLRSALPRVAINSHDIQCICKTNNIKQRPQYYYKGTVKGSPSQYSPSFIEWIIKQYEKNPQFFSEAKQTAKKSS
jgi:hypothetical protein